MFLKPTLVADDVTQIDLMYLKQLGIRGFIFDLDNTIMVPSTAKLDEPIAQWLHRIRQDGFLCTVVSNNPYPGYIREAEEVLQFPCIGNAGKPRRKNLSRALDMMDLKAHEVAVVGDRPLTDIWGGNRLGAHTVLVRSLSRAKEPGIIQLLRKLEWMTICHR